MARPLLWNPPVEMSKTEERVAKRLVRTGRLYVFLRKHRHEIFDEAFQNELIAMYKDSKRGQPPKAPAMLATVTLLQAYERRSDASTVEEAVFDLRWQMVLDCIGSEEAPFSQGLLVEFRERLIASDLDKRLLERTVEIAKRTGGFGDKVLRAALDSAPLWGAGRVEDTFNLIAHAMDIVARCAAEVLRIEKDEAIKRAKVELIGRGVKAKLDIDWADEMQRHQALQRLLADVQRLREWVTNTLADSVHTPRMKEALDALERVVQQDLEPDPDRGGQRIAQGVAKDRRISLCDPDMRHGRKSKSRVINGFKRHVLHDLDDGVILAVDVEPANRPEYEVVQVLENDVRSLEEFHIDRGYLGSPVVHNMHRNGIRIVAKPWTPANRGRFTKLRFTIDLDAKTVKCPANEVASIHGDVARFKGATCDACPLRAQCTASAPGRGRSIHIHAEEAFHQDLRTRQLSPEGRAELRKRVAIEHTLAHVCRRQGPRARYLGKRKNLYDLRRIASVENLHIADRSEREAA
jgi:hypothetical protein